MASPAPRACMPRALAPETQERHFALIPRLFATMQERRELPDGYAFRFEGERFEDVAAFVANERKCCPFLDFAIDVPSGSQDIWLRMTGPEGTREFLDKAGHDLHRPDTWRGDARSAASPEQVEGEDGTDGIRATVRKAYAEIAVGSSGCCDSDSGCDPVRTAATIGRSIGYSEEELAAAPEAANLGLGCGNPVALASLQEGNVVLDLGSGGGFDCFLASQRVGPSGRVIGVDMTPEMVARARENARKGRYTNVEFRLGKIEGLPVQDSSVDVVISNCVINLSPDRPAVFREAFRVLRPGGRLAVSDIVLLSDPPAALGESVSAHLGCVAGAALKDEYLAAIRDAGFVDLRVEESAYPTGTVCGSGTTPDTAHPGAVSLKVGAQRT